MTYNREETIERNVAWGHTRADAVRIADLTDRAHFAESDADCHAALDAIAAINRKLDEAPFCEDVELAIDLPDFKATPWLPTKVHGEAGWEMSQNWELVDGRWEGFVSIQKSQEVGR